MMINLALKHMDFFLTAKWKVTIEGATSQKYFTTYNNLSEQRTRKIFHYQLQWHKSQCSKNKRFLYISSHKNKACCLFIGAMC